MSLYALIEKRGTIAESDVNSLRRQVYKDHRIIRSEFASLLDLAGQGMPACAEWQHFLNEVSAEYFLHQEPPRQYFTDDLEREAVRRFGQIDLPSHAQVSMLVHLLRTASTVPAALQRVALTALKARVLKDGRVSSAEAELLREAIYAGGSGDGLGVSREEAELLFEINDASRDAENDPAWVDLFMKAIANHIMVQRGYQAPPREEVLRREAWLETATPGIGGFFSQMGRAVMTLEAFGARDAECYWTPRNEASDIAARDAAPITDEEARWLSARISSDGSVCEAEKALLGYLTGLADAPLPSVLQRLSKAA